MVVNYVDVALALIIVAYIISGWKRGFFITVLNFVRYAFGFALCFYISDNSAQAVYDDYVKERALERINEKIVTSDKAPQLLENLQQAVNALPKDIAGSLDISSVNLSSKNVSQEILDNLFKPILMFLTQAALFVAVFIVFFGATAVIMYYVKRAKKRRRKKEKKAALRQRKKLKPHLPRQSMNTITPGQSLHRLKSPCRIIWISGMICTASRI